jgi:hypothetical protein
MDDLTLAPFTELQEWKMPEGIFPHADTIEELCNIAGAGKLTEKEVFDLCYFLNEHRDARHTWPGEKLFAYLHGIVESGHVTDANCAHLCDILEQIERDCSRVAPVIETGDPIPETAIRIEDIVLPTLEKRVQVASVTGTSQYEVDLQRHTCSCPGWYGNRRTFRDATLKLCCTHMAIAYGLEFDREDADEDEELRKIHPLFKNLMRERSLRGRGLDHLSRWKMIRIKMHPHLVGYGDNEWCVVYAPCALRAYRRHGFNTKEQRWAFGARPADSQPIEDFLLEGTKEKKRLPA